MKTVISITKLSRESWINFKKDQLSWVLLATGGVALMLISIMAHFYMPGYKNIAALLLCFPGAIYTAILHQNGLDAAYGRKLSMMQISSTTLIAAFFFIAMSLYSPFPEYAESLSMILPEGSKYILMFNWIIHIAVSYLLVRCMFVGMTILEEKCTVLEAFHKSLKLTEGRVWLLLRLFIYLALALALSAFTVIGYFMVLPYTILMKSLLYRQFVGDKK